MQAISLVFPSVFVAIHLCSVYWLDPEHYTEDCFLSVAPNTTIRGPGKVNETNSDITLSLETCEKKRKAVLPSHKYRVSYNFICGFWNYSIRCVCVCVENMHRSE
jgi:hypothetical protein